MDTQTYVAIKRFLRCNGVKDFKLVMAKLEAMPPHEDTDIKCINEHGMTKLLAARRLDRSRFILQGERFGPLTVVERFVLDIDNV